MGCNSSKSTAVGTMKTIEEQEIQLCTDLLNEAFGEDDKKTTQQWLRSTDVSVIAKFKPALEKAMKGEYMHWLNTGWGANSSITVAKAGVALLVLVDQVLRALITFGDSSTGAGTSTGTADAKFSLDGGGENEGDGSKEKDIDWSRSDISEALTSSERIVAEIIDTMEKYGEIESLSPYMRVFVALVLAHSTDRKLHEKGLEVFISAVAAIPKESPLRAYRRILDHNREIVTRFGRFPGRVPASERSNEEKVYLDQDDAQRGVFLTMIRHREKENDSEYEYLYVSSMRKLHESVKELESMNYEVEVLCWRDGEISVMFSDKVWVQSSEAVDRLQRTKSQKSIGTPRSSPADFQKKMRRFQSSPYLRSASPSQNGTSSPARARSGTASKVKTRKKTTNFSP